MSRKQKQLISSYFKSSKSTEQSVKVSPSKRPRLNLSSLSSPSTSPNKEDCIHETDTVIATEASAIIESLTTNNFSRSLNFSAHIMDLDESSVAEKAQKDQKLTKLEEQVVKLKDDNPGVILAIEVGYKFSFFGSDAITASRVLGTFTYSKHSLVVSQVPSCRIGITVRRLVRAGHKVGVVLQSESASMKAAGMTNGGKSGTFARHLARTYTAATLVDDGIISEGALGGTSGEESEDEQEKDRLEEMDNGSEEVSTERWLACVLDVSKTVSVVFAELQTGRVMYHSDGQGDTLAEALQQVNPCEIIIASSPAHASTQDAIDKFIAHTDSHIRVEKLDAGLFDLQEARSATKLCLCEESDPSDIREWTKVYDLAEATERCLGGLIGYLRSLGLDRALKGHSGAPIDIQPLDVVDSCCDVDASSLADLEVFQRNKHERGSLFAFMNRTVSASGGRVLKGWLRKPLGTVESIKLRLEAVELLSDSDAISCLATLTSTLSSFRAIDLDAACVQLASGRLNPAKLVRVVEATMKLAQAMPSNKENEVIAQRSKLLSDELKRPQTAHMICCCEILVSLVDATAKDDKVLALRKGQWTPKSGEKSDMVASITQSLKPLSEANQSVVEVETALGTELTALSGQLKRSLSFRHLKVGALGALLYLVELPVAVPSPAGWTIVNSTKQCHRYRPPTVAALHQQLLQAREATSICAETVWVQVLDIIGTELYSPLRCFSAVLGVLDALNSLAAISMLPGYAKPSFESETGTPHERMLVMEGKHPTVDWLVQEQGNVSVANDVSLSQRGGPQNITIVTGPNMGGKSTYVRMVAVLALMGQVGSYLPCDSAQLVVFDRIRTRMGADDDIANGMSTFLVELDHCSRIIRGATARSLVILDELGRGTSTHDGVAVAKATLLYLVNRVQCATLFVTHYPEISDIANGEQVVNLHMDYMLGEKKDGVADVVFLYRAVSGEAGSSHGLNVAHLAGLPPHLLAIAIAKTNELNTVTRGALTRPSEPLEVLRGGGGFLQAISNTLSNDPSQIEESDEVRAQIANAQERAKSLGSE